jgi:hypothetical protein
MWRKNSKLILTISRRTHMPTKKKAKKAPAKKIVSKKK